MIYSIEQSTEFDLLVMQCASLLSIYSVSQTFSPASKINSRIILHRYSRFHFLRSMAIGIMSKERNPCRVSCNNCPMKSVDLCPVCGTERTLFWVCQATTRTELGTNENAQNQLWLVLACFFLFAFGYTTSKLSSSPSPSF